MLAYTTRGFKHANVQLVIPPDKLSFPERTAASGSENTVDLWIIDMLLRIDFVSRTKEQVNICEGYFFDTTVFDRPDKVKIGFAFFINKLE